ncbi:MAG TPA: L-histidine N(alpha)-methyltransferase [Candidatus Polarisedimenticolia bacterium]|jgi:dimethylhistidine N-methyltransferase|nr:L-histidine N(alpha)-methyltransferase [Candidatus Polarisedimenticolia bacterium]
MSSMVRPGHAMAPPGATDRFAIDVGDYLTRHPRQLPSRYLYDELGSALFEAICRLPWYPLTRAELRLLEAHGRDILNAGVTTVIELGSGSGAKLSALIAAAGSGRGRLDVHLVDVSGSALAQARHALEGFEGVRILTHETTYEVGLEASVLARPLPGRRLALFLGSNIGNFDPPGRDTFLASVRKALDAGDGFLLGGDLVKPERRMLLAYDDPLGVTAAFNLNLLSRINRELQGRFDLDGFTHRALWNESRSRIEMHLRSARGQRIEIRGADLDFAMAEGETIWTESSYKYDPPEVVSMLERAGFRVRAQWIDALDRFALTQAEAV